MSLYGDICLEELMKRYWWNRREFLLRAGGSAFAALGGTGSPLPAALPADQGPYSPWTLWDAPEIAGTPVALVAAAVLAANPHDTQPWLFRVSDSAIEIYADTSRHLGAMDAFLREMHLGLGCAIENACLAGTANGYDVRVDVIPGALDAVTERRARVLVARLLLSHAPARAPDPLYGAIPERHTNRYPYRRHTPIPAAWREFARSTQPQEDVRLVLIEDGKQRTDFDSAAIEATMAIIADRQMAADSDRWLRTSPAEIERHRDGPTLEAAGLSPLKLFFAHLLPISVQAQHTAWLDQTREQLASAPLVGLIAVRNRYDRVMSVAAGRLWQHLHLLATLHGVAMQPINQAVEIVDRERQLGQPSHWAGRLDALASAPGWQVTFCFRAGISAERAPRSPRRKLRDVLVA
jgi:hypothetical protein